MKAWWAEMGTVLVAVFVLALSLPPSARAHVEPGRTDVPAGAHRDEAQATADIGLEAPIVAAAGAPRADGESVVGSYIFGVEDPADENDDRVPVELATFGAAVALVLVGSAGYLLRRRLGLIKPPPEQGPEH